MASESNIHLWTDFPDNNGKTVSANIKVTVPLNPMDGQLNPDEVNFLVKATFGNFVRCVRALQSGNSEKLTGEIGMSATQKFSDKFGKPLPASKDPIIFIWCKGEHFDSIHPQSFTPTLTNDAKPLDLFKYASGFLEAVSELQDAFFPNRQAPPPNAPSLPQGNNNAPPPPSPSAPNTSQPNAQPAPPPQANITAGTLQSPRQVQFGNQQQLIHDEIVEVEIVKIASAMDKKGKFVYELYGKYGKNPSRYPSVTIRPHVDSDWTAVGGFLSTLNFTETGQEQLGSWTYTSRINNNNSRNTTYWNPVKLGVK